MKLKVKNRKMRVNKYITNKEKAILQLYRVVNLKGMERMSSNLTQFERFSVNRKRHRSRK